MATENAIQSPLTGRPEATPYLDAIEIAAIQAGQAANLMVSEPYPKNLKDFKKQLGEMHLLACNIIKLYKVDGSAQGKALNDLLESAKTFIKYDLSKLDPARDGALFYDKINEGYDLYIAYNDALIRLKKIRY